MLNDVDINDILTQFPTVTFAFAYGSGVVQQQGYDYSKVKSSNLPLVDLIFAVDNPEEWHRSNRMMNPDHYTPLFTLTDKQIAYYQSHFGAQIWYNTLIISNLSRFPGRLMKYGIISKTDLIDDLINWKCIYSAGRLQKPVQIIKSDDQVLQAMDINKSNAIRTSLLLLNSKFSEKDLYMTIASLSYVGDPRMIAGENPKKVLNLVSPVMSYYRQMYWEQFFQFHKTNLICNNSYLTPLNESGINSKNNNQKTALVYDSTNKQHNLYESTAYYQDTSHAARWELAIRLPLSLRKTLMMDRRKKGMTMNMPKLPVYNKSSSNNYNDNGNHTIMTSNENATNRGRVYFMNRPPRRASIRAALATVVAKAAVSQSFKAILTSGFMKCSYYILQKLKLNPYLDRLGWHSMLSSKRNMST